MSENSKAKTKPSFGTLWQKYGTIGIFLLLLVILMIAKPSSIFNADSIPQILKQSAVNILLALGEFFAILIAGIDLSVGAVAGLVGMLTAKMMVAGVPLPVAIIGGILLGTLIGMCNGLLVNQTGLHPFIVTLGTQNIFLGLMLVISDSRNIFGFPVSFSKTMSSSLLFLPVPVIIALVVAIFCWFFTTKCKAGRNIYALGGNKLAAQYSGVNVKKYNMLPYVLIGLFCGLSGLIWSARLGSAAATLGSGFEMDAIAAVVIGGTSMSGGVGTVGGTFIGILIIGVITNGLNLMGINSFWQEVFKGIIILAAVIIDVVRKTKSKD